MDMFGVTVSVDTDSDLVYTFYLLKFWTYNYSVLKKSLDPFLKLHVY